MSTDLCLPNMSIEQAPSFYMSKLQQNLEQSVQQFSTDGTYTDFIPPASPPPGATTSVYSGVA
jgi:hypothetical protein